MAWGALFGWDDEKVVRDGVETGPYEAWQVLVLVAVLAVLVAAVTALGQAPVTTGRAAAASLGVCFFVGFAVLGPSEDASFWPIGVALVAVGTFLATAALAVVLRHVVTRRASAG